VFSVGWGLLEYWLRRNTKLYMIVNAIMLALTLFFILSITLLFRRADARQDLSLIPFDIVSQAKDNQVLFKSMVMNIVLFIPLTFPLLWACVAATTSVMVGSGDFMHTFVTSSLLAAGYDVAMILLSWALYDFIVSS
jgi:hypothetical protein